jgi:hypothetical protein
MQRPAMAAAALAVLVAALIVLQAGALAPTTALACDWRGAAGDAAVCVPAATAAAAAAAAARCPRTAPPPGPGAALLAAAAGAVLALAAAARAASSGGGRGPGAARPRAGRAALLARVAPSKHGFLPEKIPKFEFGNELDKFVAVRPRQQQRSKRARRRPPFRWPAAPRRAPPLAPSLRDESRRKPL